MTAASSLATMPVRLQAAGASLVLLWSQDPVQGAKLFGMHYRFVAEKGQDAVLCECKSTGLWNWGALVEQSGLHVCG